MGSPELNGVVCVRRSAPSLLMADARTRPSYAVRILIIVLSLGVDYLQFF
jgi:hypothetical protein